MTNYNLKEFKKRLNANEHKQEATEFQWKFFFQHLDEESIFYDSWQEVIQPDTTVCERLLTIYKEHIHEHKSHDYQTFFGSSASWRAFSKPLSLSIIDYFLGGIWICWINPWYW